jgi:hypothetical protein
MTSTEDQGPAGAASTLAPCPAAAMPTAYERALGAARSFSAAALAPAMRRGAAISALTAALA